MQLPDQAVAYAGPSGRAFIYLDPYPRDGQLLFSPDGHEYYALASVGYAGTLGGSHKLTFADPHHHIEGKVQVDAEAKTLIYDEEVFVEVTPPTNEVVVHPLPPTRRTEYLCAAEDGTVYYVGSDRYNYSYEGFKFYIGKIGGEFRQVAIKYVNRFRDGGTTHIHTDEGFFFSPAPFKAGSAEEKLPRFNKAVLHTLNSDDYLIVESESGVTITRQ
jgi:hypothetical protein